VDARNDEYLGLRLGNLGIGELEHHHVIPIRLPDTFFPGIANVYPLGKCGVGGRQIRCRREGFFDRSVAGVAWNGLNLVAVSQGEVRGAFVIDDHFKSKRLNPFDFPLSRCDEYIFVHFVVELKEIKGNQLLDVFFVGIINTHHINPGILQFRAFCLRVHRFRQHTTKAGSQKTKN